MNYDEYVSKLNEMYNEIYCNGICSSYEYCKKDCKYSLNFYRCRVGKDYGKNIPKILIVGKEPVFPKSYNNEKIIYQVEEPYTMKDAGYNDHYLCTFYTVARLLLSDDKLPKSYLKDDMAFERYEKLRHCFAMTNYYKCVFTNDSKRSGKGTSKEMEQNCADILIKEIDTLKPDIVIIQGKNHPTFWGNIEYRLVNDVDSPVFTTVSYKNKTCQSEQGLYYAETSNHGFYVIDSYHPTQQGGFWKNTDIHKVFCDLLGKFLEKYNKN